MNPPPPKPSAPPPDPDQLVFGRYEKVRRLAVGGMGEVTLAQQHAISGFQRHVILKALLPELAARPEFVQRFLDEARVAAQLTHPGLISIHDVGRWHGDYYIAMEYVHGATLDELNRAAMQRGSPLPVDVVVRLGVDAAVALHHAHTARDAQGRALRIVHRDVTPRNIMVTLAGTTKVLDFGIARADNREGRTATGVVHGTFPYMSPEQAQASAVDGRSDQFSLGSVLWELLVGRRLWDGPDATVLHALQHEAAPRVTSLRPDVPPALSDAVARMLSKAPHQRFATCEEAAHALGAAVSGRAADTRVAALVEDLCGEVVRAKLQAPTDDGDFVETLGPRTVQDVPRARPSTMLPPVSPPLPSPPLRLAGDRTEQAQRDPPETPRTTLDGPVTVAGRRTPGDGAIRPSVHRTPQLRQAWLGGGALLLGSALVWWWGQGLPEGTGRPPPSTGMPAAPDPVPWVPTSASGVEPAQSATQVAHNGASMPQAARSPVVTLDSVPQGAEVVTREGVVLGRTPVTLRSLEAGTHRLVLRRSGYGQAPLELTLGDGQVVTQVVTLEALPAVGVTAVDPRTGRPRGTVPLDGGSGVPGTGPVGPGPVVRLVEPAGPPGYLNLDPKPWANAYVDGRFVGVTPKYKLEVPPGPHRVRLETPDGSLQWEQTVTVESGKATKVIVPLQPSP